jgi:hypothetical protein
MPHRASLAELVYELRAFAANHPYVAGSPGHTTEEIEHLYGLDSRTGEAAKQAGLSLPAAEKHPDGGCLPESGLRFVNTFPHRGFHVCPTEVWQCQMAALQERAKEVESEKGRREWVTVREAAIVAGCNPGVISRAADSGTLKSNGKKGSERRIDAADLTLWQLQKAKRGEATESDAAVERKLKEAEGE